MATTVSAPSKTFQTSAAIAQHLRVTIASTGKIAVAGAANHDIGTALRPAFAADEHIAVELASKEGTTIFIAGATIVPGSKLYAGAAGVVNTTATGVPVGIALSGGASGAKIEAVRRQFIDEA